MGGWLIYYLVPMGGRGIRGGLALVLRVLPVLFPMLPLLMVAWEVR